MFYLLIIVSLLNLCVLVGFASFTVTMLAKMLKLLVELQGQVVEMQTADEIYREEGMSAIVQVVMSDVAAEHSHRRDALFNGGWGEGGTIH